MSDQSNARNKRLHERQLNEFTYRPGDPVYLFRRIAGRGEYYKFVRPWKAATVDAKVGDLNYRIRMEDSGKMLLVHHNRLKPRLLHRAAAETEHESSANESEFAAGSVGRAVPCPVLDPVTDGRDFDARPVSDPVLGEPVSDARPVSDPVLSEPVSDARPVAGPVPSETEYGEGCPVTDPASVGGGSDTCPVMDFASVGGGSDTCPVTDPVRNDGECERSVHGHSRGLEEGGTVAVGDVTPAPETLFDPAQSPSQEGRAAPLQTPRRSAHVRKPPDRYGSFPLCV